MDTVENHGLMTKSAGGLSWTQVGADWRVPYDDVAQSVRRCNMPLQWLLHKRHSDDMRFVLSGLRELTAIPEVNTSVDFPLRLNLKP